MKLKGITFQEFECLYAYDFVNSIAFGLRERPCINGLSLKQSFVQISTKY